MSRCSVFVLLLCASVDVIKCRKISSGGGFKSASRHSASYPAHSGTVRPLGFDHLNQPHHTATARPLGFDPPRNPSAPIEHPKYNSPVANAPIGTVRPLGFDTSRHHPGATHQGQPILAPKQQTATGQNSPPYNPAGYGPPPFTPGNYGQGGYHPQGGANGPVIINNNNNNNYHQNGPGGGGYSYSPPVYTSRDTGDTALGFFLGYSLAKVTTPSYFYQSNVGNVPKYDHYTVHHYFHNRENVPSEATIQPNVIISCIGGSSSICPANTTSLCTNNGAVMCVANATSILSSKESGTSNVINYVISSVPCKDNKASECKESINNKTLVVMPCISTAKIYGHVSYVNNSILVSNPTVNSTSPAAVSSTNNTSRVVNSTVVMEGSMNITTQANADITTTEANANNTTTVNTTDIKKEPENIFCVTILALPAERQLSLGENLFNNFKDTFSKFVVGVLGIK